MIRVMAYTISAFLLLSCAPKEIIPLWTQYSEHPKYSSEEYIIGIGIAALTRDKTSDIANADANARAEIAKQIQVKIKDEFTSFKELKKDSDKSELSLMERISSQSQQSVELTLEGIEIVERFFSKSTKSHYSLAILHKSSTFIRLSREAKEHYSKCEKYFDEANILLKNNYIVGSIRKLINATELFEKAESKRTIAQILSPNLNIIPNMINPSSTLVEVIKNIYLEKISGDMQKGHISEPLSEPLTVKAIFRENIPIKDIPMTAEMPSGAGKVGNIANTDFKGFSSIKVIDVKRTGKSINYIQVFPLWDQVIEDALGTIPSQWKNRIKGPFVSFQYLLRTESTTRVLIETCVEMDSKPIDDVIIIPNIIKQFKKAGFVVNKVEGCPDSSDIKKLTNKYNDITDVFVIAIASTKFSSRRGKAYIYQGHLSLTGYDFIRNETISSIEGEAVGGAIDQKRASERALRQVTNDVVDNFINRIRNSWR